MEYKFAVHIKTMGLTGIWKDNTILIPILSLAEILN